MKFSIALHMERFSPAVDMRTAVADTIELVKLADAGGFEAMWTAEHHTIECTVAPNPFQILTWWAGHTERIRLGTATVVAPYWHPIRLAGEAALCDHLTGGRLELGIARGAYQYEFDRMANAIPEREGGAYLREIMPAVEALWAGDYAHDGPHWRFPLATSVPKPLQQPRPPVWVAARDPDTFDWAMGRGYNILSTPLSRPVAEVGILADKFRTTLANHPGIARPRFFMLRRACCYDRPDGWEVPVQCSIEYGQAFENLFRNIGTVRNGFPEQVPYETVANRGDYSPEAIRANLVIGTPDEVIEKLLVYEAAGVDQFCLGLAYNLPMSAKRRTIELFAKEVIPVFEAREREAARAGGPVAAAG